MTTQPTNRPTERRTERVQNGGEARHYLTAAAILMRWGRCRRNNRYGKAAPAAAVWWPPPVIAGVVVVVVEAGLQCPQPGAHLGPFALQPGNLLTKVESE